MAKARDININVNVDFKPLIAQLQEVIDAVDDLNDTLETSKEKVAVTREGVDKDYILVDKDLNEVKEVQGPGLASAFFDGMFQAPAEGRAPQFAPYGGWTTPLYPVNPKDEES